MTPFEEDVLYALALNNQAYRMLHDPEVGGRMDAEAVLELCRDAGFSEEAAQKAATRRADERLDDGQPPISTVWVSQ